MRIHKNRYIYTILKFMLLSACIHMVILIIFTIAKLDITMLNYFNILDLDFFFPTIAQGAVSQILSIIIMAAILIAIYFYSNKK